MKWTLKLEHIDEAGILRSSVTGLIERTELTCEADLSLPHDDGEHKKLWGVFQVAASVARTPESLVANPGYHFSKMPRRAPSRV